MIREAKQTDIPELLNLAIEGLQSDSYPELKIDRNKVFTQVSSCVIAAMNFAWVSEHDGKIVGALCAIVVPQAFYTGKQVLILMWYCKESGDGMKLMREFIRWVDQKKSINMIEYSSERASDPRIEKGLAKLGLNLKINVFYRLK